MSFAPWRGHEKQQKAWFVYAIAGWSQPVEKSGSIYCVNCELECSSMCTSCIWMKWTIGLKAVVDVRCCREQWRLYKLVDAIEKVENVRIVETVENGHKISVPCVPCATPSLTGDFCQVGALGVVIWFAFINVLKCKLRCIWECGIKPPRFHKSCFYFQWNFETSYHHY